MSAPAAGLVLATASLAATIAVALRPGGRLPDWAVSAGAAALLVALGVEGTGDARRVLDRFAPTLLFLVALLWLAEGCRRAGLFAAAARWVGRAAARGPDAQLAAVFALAGSTTVLLSLDATVLLVTPIALAVATRRGSIDRRPLFAVGHLANSASLLLPISNLTNLLAFHASDLSFVRFGALMLGPWLAVLAIEWVVLRGAGARAEPGRPDHDAPSSPEPEPLRRGAVLVLGTTLAALFAAQSVGVEPWVVALCGAAVMALVTGMGPRALAGATQPGFLVYVLGLVVVVDAVSLHGLGDLVDGLLPTGDGLLELLGAAALAAVLANLVNNLPATLILLPAAAAAGTPTLLAVLIGVGVGPNLTFTGSLATLLWRKQLVAHGVDVPVRTFTRLGLLTVPAGLVAGVSALAVALALGL
ncbi:MAG: ArsB/NhaD family transporter [Patulibacter minatonensis]